MVDASQPNEINDTPPPSRLEYIQNELREISVTLTDTVSALLGRGERLDRLVERSDELARDSVVFRNAAADTVSYAIVRRFYDVCSASMRLLTCNYVCYDVYEVLTDSTYNYGDRRQDVREMHRQ